MPIVTGLAIGAVLGGGMAAIQGRDIAQGAIMGGLGGMAGGALGAVAGGTTGATTSGLANVGAAEASSLLATPSSMFTGAGTGTASNLAAMGGGQGILAGGAPSLATMGGGQGIVAGGVPNLATMGGGQGITSLGTSGFTPFEPSGVASLGGQSASGIKGLWDTYKAPVMGGILGGSLVPPEEQKTDEETGEIRPYTFTRTQNPNFGMPGQPYYNQSYTPGNPTPASDFTGFNNGGIVALAEGGTSGPYERPIQTVNPAVTDYNRKLMEQAQQEYVNSPQLGAFQSALPNAGNYNPAAAQAFQAQQAAVAARPQQTGVGGYTFDQATGTFTKTGPSLEEPTNVGQQGMSDWDLVQRYGYNPYSSGHGGADGGGGGGGGGGAGGGDGGGGGDGSGGGFASGGGIRDLPSSHLGDYSDGGRLLKGPGDGVSDDIPAQIGEKQPARLADGEFVVPARIVSEIGNGSTDAGAKRLYQMMDRVQKARKKSVGKGKVAVDSKAYKHLPV